MDVGPGILPSIDRVLLPERWTSSTTGEMGRRWGSIIHHPIYRRQEGQCPHILFDWLYGGVHAAERFLSCAERSSQYTHQGRQIRIRWPNLPHRWALYYARPRRGNLAGEGPPLVAVRHLSRDQRHLVRRASSNYCAPGSSLTTSVRPILSQANLAKEQALCYDKAVVYGGQSMLELHAPYTW